MSSNLPIPNPAIEGRNETIIQKRLQGKAYRQIAKETGVSKATVCRVLNKEECRDVLNTGQRQIISLVPKAVDNLYTFLDSNNETIKHKATNDVLRITGIDTPRTDHPVTHQYIGQVNINQIDPEVYQLLLGRQANETAIDAEYTVDDTL